MIYIDLLLVALVTIYVVDISGFTESWRSLVATKLHVSRLKPLPPFDCGKCMTWWVCLIYALCTGHLSHMTIRREVNRIKKIILEEYNHADIH
jgi:hypothetical protein